MKYVVNKFRAPKLLHSTLSFKKWKCIRKVGGYYHYTQHRKCLLYSLHLNEVRFCAIKRRGKKLGSNLEIKETVVTSNTVIKTLYNHIYFPRNTGLLEIPIYNVFLIKYEIIWSYSFP